MALALFGGGGFWGASMPRRLRPVHWVGVCLVGGVLVFVLIAIMASRLG